ncbi:hypothetical protein METH109765_07540 [Mesobacillus thioparans]
MCSLPFCKMYPFSEWIFATGIIRHSTGIIQHPTGIIHLPMDYKNTLVTANPR